MKRKNKYLNGLKKVKCPVCKQTKLISGLKVHIITSAKQEVYDWYIGMQLNDADKIKSKPHQDYLENKVKIIQIEKKEWDL